MIKLRFNLQNPNDVESAYPAPTDIWPNLPLEAWQDTYATLHMWTQIIDKIRFVQTPWINHSWHVFLYVTARGLTTSTIPYGSRVFQVDFDFINHELLIQNSEGTRRTISLYPRSVANFYHSVMETLEALDIHITINTKPNEVADPIRFEQDETHAAYDADYANRFWRVLLQSDRVFREFRSHFCGKVSPVHFSPRAAKLAEEISALEPRGNEPNLAGIDVAEPACADAVLAEIATAANPQGLLSLTQALNRTGAGSLGLQPVAQSLG